MDAVITYVNGLDPVWQKSYAEFQGDKAITKRYRDWGTLKYLLRGIQRHIPEIRNVFLVVSSASQVPSWADESNLGIVLHRDIIPEEFLPTFNSTTIEMFLHRIPGLDEEFLYFNDDMFPVMDCTHDDFFHEGKATIAFRHHLLCSGGYKHRVRNSDRQARKALGKRAPLMFVRPQHICSPMLKSESERVFNLSKEKIYQVISRVRTVDNINQYLFLDYLYLQGKVTGKAISNKHLSPAVHSPEKICAYIDNPSTKLVCINDVQMEESVYENFRDKVVAAMERHFPDKSKYEH